MSTKSEGDAATVHSNGHSRKSNPVTRRYLVRDTTGTIVAIHERVNGSAGKYFKWVQPNGIPGLNGTPVTKLPLYGSARLSKLPANVPVIVTEGEKACESLWKYGYAAVGTVTGARTIPADDSIRVLLGRPVLLWPDADEPGRSHMRRIADRLHALGHKDVRLVVWSDAPPKGDVADFRGTKTDLQALLDSAQRSVLTENYKLIRVADVIPKPVRWAWKYYIPLGKLTVCDGDPGLGKSLASIDIAARVSRGRVMPDGTRGDLLGPRGAVLISAEDDPADTIRPRLEAAGADLTRVGLLVSVRDAGDGEIRSPLLEDLDVFRSIIEEMDAALVIIDPLMAFLPDDRDSYRDQHIRRVLAPLATLANETNVAIVVIRHLNKKAGGNPIYRGGGSIGIIGAARSGLLVARDPEDPQGQNCVLALTKSNLSRPAPSLRYRVIEIKPGVPGIEWLGESAQTAAMLLSAAGEDEETVTERDTARTWLRELLADEAVPAKRILAEARQMGFSEKTLRRASKAEGVQIAKESFSGGWVWTLPDKTSGPTSKMAMNSKMAHQLDQATLASSGYSKLEGLSRTWKPIKAPR